MTTTPIQTDITKIERPTDSFYPDLQRKTFQLGGQTAVIESGKIARSASANVMLYVGENVIMVNATVSEKPRPGIDFFPLLVDYEEKLYSVGRIPGGYLKREGKPSDKAVLTSRLIDRPIRPLFPDGYRRDVQIVATPLSLDGITPPDTLAVFAASAALEMSGAPFMGPVGAVRVAQINGQLVANPTYDDIKNSPLDLIVSGTEDAIIMVEAGSDFVPESLMIEAMAFAHEEIKRQVIVQKEFAKQCGKEKPAYVPEFDTAPLLDLMLTTAKKDVEAAYHEFDRDKRKEQLKAAKEKAYAAVDALEATHPIQVLIASSELDFKGEAFKKVEKKVMRAMVLDEGIRADGRKATEIRPIQAEVGVLPRVHGTGLFTRGSTQVLSICTLGAPGDAQKLDGVDPATEKKWLHHYTFPGYSTGEVRPMRGVGRREVGHGALAERAIMPVLPPESEFPYTIRVNSDVVESNGSTSMASTCGTSLALMDAGVPLKSHIGGIAMGLIKEGDRYVILSDIQGIEDFLGDMDFKVTGNEVGITALQMDMKITGISLEMLKIALDQAREGRLHILGKMMEAIKTPRAEMSPWAPSITTIQIDPSTIGAVIGPGGKMIRSIVEQTGVQIDINDDGLVMITSNDQAGAAMAKKIIEDLTRKIEPGLILEGKVARILPIGAIVEFGPNKDGLVHISQFSHQRINNVEDVVKLGDKVLVKVTDVDDRGRTNLSIKAVDNATRAEFGYPPLPERTPAPSAS